MRVKVGATWYSSKDFPIMVQLSPYDKLAINNMAPDADRYATFQTDDDDPSMPTLEAQRAWMCEGYREEWNGNDT